MFSENFRLVQVLPSPIHGSGLFARTNIVPGTMMGPYKGIYMNAEERSHVMDGSYIWKINEDRFVDAKHCVKNNPLRYVNGAKTPKQKTLANCEVRFLGATPKTEKVYYMVTKPIKKGEELIISYGNNYFPKKMKTKQKS